MPGGETIGIGWLASPLAAQPTVKPLLDKYIVVSVVHTRRQADGTTVWDDVHGVQIKDGAGNALKEVSADMMPPTLIGMIATSEATLRQNSQGKGKLYWSVWEAGSVNACQRGKLIVSYNGEDYSFDTPLPTC